MLALRPDQLPSHSSDGGQVRTGRCPNPLRLRLARTLPTVRQKGGLCARCQNGALLGPASAALRPRRLLRRTPTSHRAGKAPHNVRSSRLRFLRIGSDPQPQIPRDRQEPARQPGVGARIPDIRHIGLVVPPGLNHFRRRPVSLDRVDPSVDGSISSSTLPSATSLR